MLLVVIEDALDTLDTRVLSTGVLFLCRSLVPIQNAADEGGDEEGIGFSGSNCLDLGEHECQIAVDLMLGLKHFCGFDALPCGSNFDEDILLVNANAFVELRL